jgi:hypothetical protein
MGYRSYARDYFGKRRMSRWTGILTIQYPVLFVSFLVSGSIQTLNRVSNSISLELFMVTDSIETTREI